MPDLDVTSVFENDGKIPVKYTADGQDISPPLALENIDEDTETIAIIADDPDAPIGIFTHWVIWNIPADIVKIPEGIPQEEKVEELGNASQGSNDFGEVGYRGPAPPSGIHTYHFKVYTLDSKMELCSGADKSQLQDSMEGHILQQALLRGDYSR